MIIRIPYDSRWWLVTSDHPVVLCHILGGSSNDSGVALDSTEENLGRLRSNKNVPAVRFLILGDLPSKVTIHQPV